MVTKRNELNYMTTNETNQNQAQIQAQNEVELPPTLAELAEMSSNFIAAKNYNRGAKVSFTLDALEKMQKSEKYGNWQAIFQVTKDGEPKRFGMSGKIASTCVQQYKCHDYKDMIGKTLTLLVVKASSGMNTFEVVDLK